MNRDCTASLKTAPTCVFIRSTTLWVAANFKSPFGASDLAVCCSLLLPAGLWCSRPSLLCWVCLTYTPYGLWEPLHWPEGALMLPVRKPISSHPAGSFHLIQFLHQKSKKGKIVIKKKQSKNHSVKENTDCNLSNGNYGHSLSSKPNNYDKLEDRGYTKSCFCPWTWHTLGKHIKKTQPYCECKYWPALTT